MVDAIMDIFAQKNFSDVKEIAFER